MKKIFDNKHIYVPFLLLLFLFVSYLVSDCFFDNDGYWIIASGKYIVENGIPKTNPFTFVKDLEIIINSGHGQFIATKYILHLEILVFILVLCYSFY